MLSTVENGAKVIQLRGRVNSLSISLVGIWWNTPMMGPCCFLAPDAVQKTAFIKILSECQ
jgi:hypothetical protein